MRLGLRNADPVCVVVKFPIMVDEILAVIGGKFFGVCAGSERRELCQFDLTGGGKCFVESAADFDAELVGTA